MKKLAGVIFDLDGTLIKSEDNYYLSDRKFLQSLGGDYTKEMHQSYAGMGSRNFVQKIQKELGLKQSTQELLKTKDSLYLEQALGNTQSFPEMIKLLKALYLQRLPLAIASGSTPGVISALLEDLKLERYFDLTLSTEDVEQGKPAPDVFLEVAKKWDLSPENILVIEDSVHGIKAAKAAGMPCVAVPYVWGQAQEEQLREAELFIEGGSEKFQAEMILEWIDDHFCRCEDCRLFEKGLCVDPD